jgi:predicted anti-sigma-YlaC factor YlaD
MHRAETLDNHARFKELCALAQANSLDRVDRLELKEHLEICDSCRQIYDQYAAIQSKGMAYLSGSYAMSEDAERWDSREVRQKLFASIQGMEAHEVQVELAAQFSVDRGASERR